MRILLVEDNLELAEALAEALMDECYLVDVLNNGEAAWEQARLIDYDLMLLDMELPNLDGIGLCQKLRCHGYRSPIFLMTGFSSRLRKLAGSEAGADEYFLKPFEFHSLLTRIRDYCPTINP